MSKNVKRRKSFTKEKKYPPKIQKTKPELDIAKQETNKPACLAQPTNGNGTEDGIYVLLPENERDVLSHLLPENEKAVDDGGIAEKTNRIWEQMSLFPVWKMGQIKNALSDCLFAQIIEDNKGIRTVNFCQQYLNRNFSPVMSVLQSDLIMAAIYISKKGEEKDLDFNTSIVRNIAKFKQNFCKDYYGKFGGCPADAYNIADIINTLYSAIPYLPDYKDDTREFKRRALYWDIIDRLDSYAALRIVHIDGYYALTEYDLTYLAQDTKRDKLSLLREMRDYGFLYIQSSASGYQSNIRLKNTDGTTYTEWRYCIYRINYFTGEKEKEFDYDAI